MTVVDEPTSGGGSLPLVFRIVETSDEKFCEVCGWVVVGVDERGALVFVVVGGCCCCCCCCCWCWWGAVMEELEAVMIEDEGKVLLFDDMGRIPLPGFFLSYRMYMCVYLCMYGYRG